MRLSLILSAFPLALAVVFPQAAKAQDYDMDCKLLLCLPVGFPDGCGDAYDHMIDRRLAGATCGRSEFFSDTSSEFATVHKDRRTSFARDRFKTNLAQPFSRLVARARTLRCRLQHPSLRTIGLLHELEMCSEAPGTLAGARLLSVCSTSSSKSHSSGAWRPPETSP